MRALPGLLAWARLRRNPLRNLTIVGVVATAIATLLALAGIAYSSGNSIVSYSLSRVATGEQNITLNSSQIITSRPQYQATDNYLAERLKEFSDDTLTREDIFSELTDQHGIRFSLGAANEISKSVALVSGRMPNTCTASLCEVLQIVGSAPAVPRPQSLGLKIVGRARIQNKELFAGTMSPPQGTTLLISTDLQGVTQLPHFLNLHGTDAWVTNINLAKLRDLGTNNYLTKIVAFEDQLSIDYSNIILTWPQDALTTASDQSETFAKKVNLVGFAVVSLLLAYLAVIAYRQRREQQQFRASLSRIGTPKRVLTQELLLENSLPVIFGVLLALIFSPSISWALSEFGFHVPLAHLYSHWILYFYIWLSATATVVDISIYGDSAWRKHGWLAVAVSMAALVAFLLKSGVSDSRYLAIPFLYALFPSAVCYMAIRFIAQLLRTRRHQLFIIFREYLPLWRGVAAILALTSILAMMSLGFASGVSKNISGAAREQVPLDISLKTGSSLVRPLDLATPAQYANLVSGSTAYPILRTGTSIRSQGVVADSLSLIGAPSAAIEQAEPALSNFSKSLIPIAAIPSGSIAIHSARSMTVTLNGIPPEVDLLGWFITPGGLRVSAMFQQQVGSRTLLFAGQIPTESSLIAFEFQESSNYLSRRLHANGEGDYSIPILKGKGTISSISLDGQKQYLNSAVWGSSDFSYSFDGNSRFVRPAPPNALPVVATDPITAALAIDHILTLNGASNNYFQVRVGAITKYFPSAGDRFVIMELSQLQNQIARTDIGGTNPIEVWVSTPHSSEYLARLDTANFQGLSVESRSVLAATLAADPNSSGLISAYKVSLGFALLLSLLVAYTTLPLLRREGSKVFFYLESSGATPQLLKRVIRISFSFAVVTGVVVGCLIGVVVSRSFVTESVPALKMALFALVTVAIAGIGAAAISRGYFTEETMVAT